MSEINSDRILWLIDRADRLRAGTAASAGAFIATLSILLTALTYGVGWAWSELAAERLWVPAVLGVSWLMLVVALFTALDSLSHANGFSVWTKSGAITASSDPHISDEALCTRLEEAVAGYDRAVVKLRAAARLTGLAPGVVFLAAFLHVFA